MTLTLPVVGTRETTDDATELLADLLIPEIQAQPEERELTSGSAICTGMYL